MLKISLHISDETRKSIKAIYGKDGYCVVEDIVNDIIERYLGVEHFDPELEIEEDDRYEICKFCGEKSKHSRTIDIDGKNIVERDICENCGSGQPSLK